ncbi:MAG: ROK family protein [Phototrophicaceae bacterium]|jgi:predicted NBD/HSP70 family sugar kinase
MSFIKTRFNTPNTHPSAPIALDSAQYLALTALRQRGQLSRTHLAEVIGYSPSKITGLVNDLIGGGILEETDDSTYTGGRRAKDLYFNPAYGYIVGVVIGVDKLDVAVIDARENVRVRRMVSIQPEDSPVRIMESLSRIVLERLQQLSIPIERVYGVGVTLPTAIDSRKHTPYASAALPAWGGYQLESYLREVFPYAVVMIERDANGMAFAELRRGAGRYLNHLLYLNLGEPVGVGIILDGHIYRGANGRAGMMLDLPNALSDTLPIEDSAQWIGRALAQLVNFIDPELILVGGDSPHVGASFLASLRRSILDYSQSLATQHLQIDLAPLGTEANLTGITLLTAEAIFTVAK